MSRLSVVLPAYNEELMVGKTCRVLHEVLAEAGISYELVVVDDGSKDKTWEEITKAGEKDGNVLGVHFSRNFGKEAAVYAGMAQATGDVVAVMDCDPAAPAGNFDFHVPSLGAGMGSNRRRKEIKRNGKSASQRERWLFLWNHVQGYRCEYAECFRFQNDG